MSDPIKLIITAAGLEAALNVELTGIVIKLDKVKFSTDLFESVVNDPHTDLANVVAESSIVAGGTSASQNTLRFTTMVNTNAEHTIGSLGLYTDDDVLFAIASVDTGYLMKLYPRVSFVMAFGMSLSTYLLENITVVIDGEASIAAAMIFQHEDHENPHPQYLLIENIPDPIDISGKYDKAGGPISGDVSISGELEINSDATEQHVNISVNTEGDDSYADITSGSEIDWYQFDKPIRAPSFIGEAGLGVGQTWVDVTASRVVGTTYTNDTPKPIMISISGEESSDAEYLKITVGGVVVAHQDIDGADNNTNVFLTTIVPAGAEYVVDTNELNTTAVRWAELR